MIDIKIFFLFSIALHFVCVASLFEGCDSVVNLNDRDSVIFQSSNFSYTNINLKYEPGSSCRVQYIAPEGYFIRISGRINLDRKTKIYSCAGQSQKFLISRDGNKEFIDSEITCATDTITMDSISNEMTVGYTSESDGSGRFQLNVKAVKVWKQKCECGWGVYVSNSSSY